MPEDVKHFVAAPKAAMEDQIPSDWQDQLKQLPGLEVVGDAFGRMQFKATDQALQKASARLGHVLHFEEVEPRKFGV